MLELPDVTLMGIDTLHPNWTLGAMHYSMRWVKFGAAILLTNTHKHRNLNHMDQVRMIHHEESDKKIVPYLGHAPIAIDYQMAQLRMPSEYSKTPYTLFMEWDSALLNPRAWTDDFLKYDFIGAPWPPHNEPGWPVCTRDNNVGNSGFSLRSRKFNDLVRQATDLFRGDNTMLGCDRWMCRTKRPWLQGFGVEFAPEDVAAKFSCENQVYTGQFGFHGKGTAQLNHWMGPFAHLR